MSIVKTKSLTTGKKIAITLAVLIVLTAVALTVTYFGMLPFTPCYKEISLDKLKTTLAKNKNLQYLTYIEEMPFDGEVTYYLAYPDGKNNDLLINFDKLSINLAQKTQGYVMLLKSQDLAMILSYNIEERDRLPYIIGSNEIVRPEDPTLTVGDIPLYVDIYDNCYGTHDKFVSQLNDSDIANRKTVRVGAFPLYSIDFIPLNDIELSEEEVIGYLTSIYSQILNKYPELYLNYEG